MYSSVRYGSVFEIPIPNRIAEFRRPLLVWRLELTGIDRKTFLAVMGEVMTLVVMEVGYEQQHVE